MTDLVKRARDWHVGDGAITGDIQLYRDLADRIEALEAALWEMVNEWEWMTSDIALPERLRNLTVRARALLAGRET